MKKFLLILIMISVMPCFAAQHARTKEEQQKLNTDFITAMMGLHLEPAQQALAQGADINGTTQAGDTVLMLWVKGISITQYEWFLNLGPSPFVKSKKGRTAYEYYSVKLDRFMKLLKHPQQQKTIVALLQKVFAETTPIHMKDLVTIIQEYAFFGPTTENLNAALFSAIHAANAHYVNELLLSCGAESNCRLTTIEDENYTPLMYLAVCSGKYYTWQEAGILGNIANSLIAHGADISAKDKHGKTAVQHAENQVDSAAENQVDSAHEHLALCAKNVLGILKKHSEAKIKDAAQNQEKQSK